MANESWDRHIVIKTPPELALMRQAGKVNALAGFASSIGLALAAAYMAFESLARLASPVPIDFAQATVVAVLGLLVIATSIGAGILAAIARRPRRILALLCASQAALILGGIVVTNYLHRPLWPRLIAAIAPGCPSPDACS